MNLIHVLHMIIIVFDKNHEKKGIDNWVIFMEDHLKFWLFQSFECRDRSLTTRLTLIYETEM